MMQEAKGDIVWIFHYFLSFILWNCWKVWNLWLNEQTDYVLKFKTLYRISDWNFQFSASLACIHIGTIGLTIELSFKLKLNTTECHKTFTATVSWSMMGYCQSQSSRIHFPLHCIALPLNLTFITISDINNFHFPLSDSFASISCSV